jgi:chromosome segregation ATPase
LIRHQTDTIINKTKDKKKKLVVDLAEMEKEHKKFTDENIEVSEMIKKYREALDKLKSKILLFDKDLKKANNVTNTKNEMIELQAEKQINVQKEIEEIKQDLETSEKTVVKL